MKWVKVTRLKQENSLYSSLLEILNVFLTLVFSNSYQKFLLHRTAKIDKKIPLLSLGISVASQEHHLLRRKRVKARTIINLRSKDVRQLSYQSLENPSTNFWMILLYSPSSKRIFE